MSNKIIIAESNELRLEHEYEYTCLVRKSNEQILFEDDFYGDPYCGLIDKENKWAIVAGQHMTFWTPELVEKYQSSEFEWIHSVRLKDTNTVEILIDPWSEKSAVWEFDIESKALKKIRDFNKYKEEKYTEEIEW